MYKSSSGITVQFLFNRLSSSFGISLFLFVWEGGWSFCYVFWLNPTFILCMRCMSYVNFIGNQARVNHTFFPCFVQTPQNVGQTLYIKFALHKVNMKFLTYLVFGHPHWIFLLFLNFVYYPWVPIVHGPRRDYSWNNNVKFKVMFTLYQIDFRTARKSHPVSYEHLSDMWISTIRYDFRAGAKALQYIVRA